MYSKDGYKRNSKDKKRPYNIIPSGDITMEGVDFPVHGTDNLGNSQIMMPGTNYTFPGDEVFEVPLAQKGGESIMIMGDVARANEAGLDTKYSDLTTNLDLTKDEKQEIAELVLGFFPFAGEAIDAKNTVQSLAEGRYGDAGLNALGLIIPFIPGKILTKGKNAIKKWLGKNKDSVVKKVKESNFMEEAVNNTPKRLPIPGADDFPFYRNTTLKDDILAPLDFKNTRKYDALGIEAPSNMSWFTPNYESTWSGIDGKNVMYRTNLRPKNPIRLDRPEMWTVERIQQLMDKGHDAIIVRGSKPGTRMHSDDIRDAYEIIPLDKRTIQNLERIKQKGGATVPTEQVAQDDPRYNRDMDDDGVPVGVDIDDSVEVPNQLMLLQAMKESSLDPKKISKKGAKGLTQVMPDTLTDYIKQTGDKDVDVYNWEDSMKIQKWYMNNIYKRPWINKQNQTQDVRLAKTLAAYNWGPTNFNEFLNKVKGGVDIYDNKMEWLDHPELPIETRDYIKAVLLRQNDKFEGWIKDHNKDESKQAYIEAYGGIYKKGGSLLFPEWKRVKKHWKNYLSGKSINRDMYNKMVAYGFIKKKKYRRPDKRNRSFENISSKNVLKALNLGKMKKGGSLPEQVKIYEDYVRGIFDGTDLEEKAKRTADKIDRFYYYDLKGKDTHTLDHIKKLQKGGDMQFDKMNQTARLQEAGYDTTYEDLSGKRTPVTKEQALEAGEIAGGFVPYLGEAIDAKNTIKSAVEGRYGDMVMNAAGLMVPFFPGKVLVKGKNAIKNKVKNLFKKGSKETTEKVVKKMPEWSKGVTNYNPKDFATNTKAREKYIKSGQWREARKNALLNMKDQGKYLDDINFDAKTLKGENMVFHGTDGGRSLVEVALPDGRTQLMYKSTDMSGKGVGDLWQPYGGHSYMEYTDELGDLKSTDNWFIKDEGYENFYDSKSYRDIATELDRHMIEQGWDMSDQIIMKEIDGKMVKTYPYRK